MRRLVCIKKTFVGLLAFLFLLGGILVWAVSRDRFVREWYAFETDFGKMRAVAIVPKPIREVPVVILLDYRKMRLEERDDSLLRIAELGVAAVGIEFLERPLSEEEFSECLRVLQQLLAKKEWARIEAIGLLDSTFGFQSGQEYFLENSAFAPLLYMSLVRDKTDFSKRESAGSVLFLRDSAGTQFSVKWSESGEAYLIEGGEFNPLNRLPFASSGNSLLTLRVAAEYAKAFLTPENPVPEIPRPPNFSVILCLVPGLLLGGLYFSFRRKEGKKRADFEESLGNGRIVPDKVRYWIWGISGGAAVIAIALTGIHLIVPQLPINQQRLSVAGFWIVPGKQKGDFDFLSKNVYWKNDHRVRILLTHLELAYYCLYELVNWQVEKPVYRNYILSPIIDDEDLEAGADLDWRRPLWVFFYPRVRKEEKVEEAAEIIARELRTRVTIVEGDFSREIPEIWQTQIANPAGFERIYVAALRSSAVPARLDGEGYAEILTAEGWQAAPRPAVGILKTDIREELISFGGK